MKKRNASLQKVITLLAVATMVSGGMNTTVFADTTLNNTELHAGAATIITPLLQDAGVENEDDADLLAGAALFLQGDEMLLADGASVSENDITVLDAELDVQSDVVMANVKNSVNVRAEASEDAETVGKLFKNCGGIIIEQKDGWTLLQSGDLKGWTKDEYLLFGADAQALREEVGSLKATVKTDGLRVRKEANADAGVYGVLAVDDKVAVTDENDEWVAVKYDKDTVGYVSAEYVDVEFVVDTGKTNKQIEKEELAKAAKEKEKAKAAEKKKLSKNRGAVAVAGNDVTLLAALIQCEAGRESYEGKLAVGAVVMNRVRSGAYPGSISGVITAPGQFPPATNGKVSSVVAKGPSSACIKAAQEAIAGASNVGGATHFRSASSGASGIVIGNHVFW